jgi:threonine dehydratase
MDDLARRGRDGSSRFLLLSEDQLAAAMRIAVSCTHNLPDAAGAAPIVAARVGAIQRVLVVPLQRRDAETGRTPDFVARDRYG